MTKKGLFTMAFAACSMLCAGAAAETPLFRVGLMTDTHWSEDPKSFDRTEEVLKVFKRESINSTETAGKNITEANFDGTN